MLNTKSVLRRRSRDKPQFYQPRVEVALLALADAVSGCQQLIRFITEQQGPSWRDQGDVLDAAEADFTKAQGWLNKRRKKGGQRA